MPEVLVAAALLLAAQPLVGDDTPEQARQKAIKKAQDALIAAAKARPTACRPTAGTISGTSRSVCLISGE